MRVEEVTAGAIEARARALIEKALNDPGCPYRIERPSINLSVRLDLRGLAAGCCQSSWRADEGLMTITIRINQDAIQLDPQFVMGEVVPHEVAHALAYMLFVKRCERIFHGHGAGWRQLAIWLGASGSRTCSIGLQRARKVKRYAYVASCGTRLLLGSRMHARLSAGENFKLRGTGGKVNRACYQGVG